MKAALGLVPTVLSMMLVASVSNAEPNGYVQGGVMVTVQPAGVANHRVRPPISGEALGVSAGGGVFVTRTLAIEGEVVASQAVSTRQQFFYNWTEDYIGESRDTFLGANVRWAARRHLEFVGGGGLALSTFAERSIVRTDMFPPRMTRLPDQVETARQLTLNGGVAVPLPVSRTIDVVPAFTIRWVDRDRDPNDLGAYNGVGNYSYQAGCVVRFKVN